MIQVRGVSSAVDSSEKEFDVRVCNLENKEFGNIIVDRVRACKGTSGEDVAYINSHAITTNSLMICTKEIKSVEAEMGVIIARI